MSDLDRRERVGDRARAHALDVGRVVARAAVVVVLAGGDAVADEEREEGRGHIAGVQPLDDVVAPDLDVDEVAQLLLEGGEELVEGLERARIAGLRAELLAGARIDAVVQRDFQHLGQVEVAGEVVVLLAERAGFDAAAGAAAAGVHQALARAQHLLR